MNLNEQNKRRFVVLIEWFEKLGIGSMYLCSVYGWTQIVSQVLHESDNANLIHGRYGQKTIMALYFLNFLLLSVSLGQFFYLSHIFASIMGHLFVDF